MLNSCLDDAVRCARSCGRREGISNEMLNSCPAGLRDQRSVVSRVRVVSRTVCASGNVLPLWARGHDGPVTMAFQPADNRSPNRDNNVIGVAALTPEWSMRVRHRLRLNPRVTTSFPASGRGRTIELPRGRGTVPIAMVLVAIGTMLLTNDMCSLLVEISAELAVVLAVARQAVFLGERNKACGGAN